MTERFNTPLAPNSLPPVAKVEDVSRYIASARTQLARNRTATSGALATTRSDDILLEQSDQAPGLTRLHRLRSIGILVTALWISVTLITSAAIVATSFFL
jgi:hypothetical protein